ncbi:MAG: hypothetical protein PWP52_781 [Bacteroidales bacterium]|nr:hypothetical protein [Bacteroidales bacterium]
MMKNFFLITSLLIISSSLFSQTSCNGVIIDKNTNRKVPFANVYLSNKEAGTYSNNQGVFSLEVTPEDTIIVSVIGYEKRSIPVQELENLNREIYLTPKHYNLDEITIHADKKARRNKILLGNSQLKKATTLIAHSGAEYAVYIPNNLQTEALISEVVLNLKSRGRETPVFRIHLYAVNKETKLPGDDLLNQDLTGMITKSRNIKKFDLQKYNIVLPEDGVFVGVEWIGKLTKNDVFIDDVNDIKLAVPISFEKKQSNTFFRSAYYTNRWNQTTRNHPLSVILEKDNPPNAAFGLKVITYVN